MDAMVDAPELAARYMRLVDGFVTTQLLYVAASLDVGGRLAGGPMSARRQLLRVSPSPPRPVRRVPEVLLGARERTEAEFRNLLGAASFAVQRVVRTGSSVGLGIVEAVAR